MATIKSTERDDSSFPHLYQLNGRYRIDPANSNDDLLNDVGCLLEAVEGVLQGIVDNNDDTSAWAAMYLVRQAQGINTDLCSRELARRRNHG